MGQDLSYDEIRDLVLGPEDSCMDSGGCWDSVDGTCRKNEPNAQELCDRANSK